MALHIPAQAGNAQCELRVYDAPVTMELFIANARLLGQKGKTLNHDESSFSPCFVLAAPYLILSGAGKARKASAQARGAKHKSKRHQHFVG
jgi:hypothetical protein